MRGGTWAGSIAHGVQSTSWQPAAVADFNNDGAADALWLDAITGGVEQQLWFL